MECYFDNSATTKPCPEAVAAMTEALTETWGNPSSLHSVGDSASRLLEASRKTLAAAFRCQPDEVFFTGSGTEANNLAIIGSVAAMQQTGDRINTAMSQMGQNQNALLESMQRQLLLSTRNQEERIGQMSTGVNETLAQLDARMEQVRQATATGMENLRQEMFTYLDNILGETDRVFTDHVNSLRLTRQDLNARR